MKTLQLISFALFIIIIVMQLQIIKLNNLINKQQETIVNINKFNTSQLQIDQLFYKLLK